jgi:hypothetical protein
MARLLIAGLLGAAAVTPLLAQPVAPPAPTAPIAVRAPMAPMARAPMARSPMTRADVQARVQQQFARRDTNRDGFLVAEELAMRGGMRGGMAGQRNIVVRRMGPGGAVPQAMGNADAAFDRLDANRDGSISRAEFGQARQVRIEKRVMVDGQPGQPGAMRMMRRGGGGGMLGPALLQRADANRDGRVSLAEATGAALQHFDMMDRNRDGRLTPDERAAGRAHIMHMRKAG